MTGVLKLCKYFETWYIYIFAMFEQINISVTKGTQHNNNVIMKLCNAILT